MRRAVIHAVVCGAVTGGLLLSAMQPAHMSAQQSRPAAAKPTVVRGMYNWIHTTADSERSFPFYRDGLGIQLARSPFGGPAPASGAPEQIRPISNAAPDPLIWDLTDTKGSRFRNVFMRTPNTPFGLELSEFVDIERGTRRPNPWDPGVSTLIFRVRDLDAVVAKLKANGTTTVTLGDKPVDTRAGRSILFRDPDGYLIQLTQAAASDIANAKSPDQVIGTSIGITVADTATALKFYQGLLGFDVRETLQATTDELKLNGLAAGQIKQTVTVLPGTAESVIFSEYTFSANARPPVAPNPFHWRIQDVGAPQFQLQVSGLDALIVQTQKAGYRFLSVGAKPIQRAFGRFVFAIDPDGVLVEFAEPAAAN